jgi:pyruvyl transferase EpsO
MIQINANNAADSLSTLKLQLKSILNLFDPKSQVFYIDYPVHGNIGDLLINLGTEQFFLDNQIPIQRRYSALNMRSLANLKIDEGATFLCHGGGNFGDLYPMHQNFREWWVDKFPRARIIFLPQSLHYSSPEAQQKSLEKIARHSNCHIFVRDRESLAALHSARVTQSSMMPDMAHQLWETITVDPLLEQRGRKMYFLRRDKEATSPPAELVEAFTHRSVDWSDIISTPHRVFAASVHYSLRAGGWVLPASLNVSLWYAARDKMIHDAVNYFSKHDRVYTNRLHAMLLGLLLGRDVGAFDNSYGKLSRYINTWLPTAIQS